MIVPPGSTIGIIGGGQLGRMLGVAAAQLGYKCHIYAPDDTPPAGDVAAKVTKGRFDDEDALARFAGQVDIATYEFENIAAGPLAAVTRHVQLYPSPDSLDIAQDRLTEKEFVQRVGGRPAPYARVDDRAGLEAALDAIGIPAILKTRRLGYDGKGQARITTAGDADAAWDAIKAAPSVLEGFVTFDAEFSILICRGADGGFVTWDAPHNIHTDGILDRSIVPADASLAPAIAVARDLAIRIADALDHVGLLALEFFAVGEEAVFNEMAPRVHNSGHWTIEGATTSQFENHIRAICGLPLGETALTAPRIEMRNLIGNDAAKWREILADPAVHLHLYGKQVPLAGRKMGHITRLIA